MVEGLGFRVRAWDTGLRIQGSGIEDEGSGVRG